MKLICWLTCCVFAIVSLVANSKGANLSWEAWSAASFVILCIKE